MMAEYEEAKKSDFKLMMKKEDKKLSEHQIRPLVEDLNQVKQEGKELKSKIVNFLKETYNLSEVFLRK